MLSYSTQGLVNNNDVFFHSETLSIAVTLSLISLDEFGPFVGNVAKHLAGITTLICSFNFAGLAKTVIHNEHCFHNAQFQDAPKPLIKMSNSPTIPHFAVSTQLLESLN